MHVLVIGAAGMVGRKLTDRLTSLGGLSEREITRFTLVDVVEPPRPSGFSSQVDVCAVDITSPNTVSSLVADRPDVIFHLAAMVSGEAEDRFEAGYAINLAAFQALIEAIRLLGTAQAPYKPKLIFTSSIAIFGAPFPAEIDDEFHHTPLTSYGTQKAISELLLNDYSRKGFLDGVGIRLPTICIRPGHANLAASSFFSNILREPLVGQETILPVSKNVRHWHASPKSAVGFLIHAANLDTKLLGDDRCMSMPGLSATVAEQIDALERVAGAKAVSLIKEVPDAKIIKIVEGWPQSFIPKRSISLGFQAETSFDEIIKTHINDELNGIIAT